MSKKTLNKANLTELGSDKLADLLLEVSSGSADIKRRLRLELSHHLGSEELGRDVRKRLVSIRKSKTYAGWRKRKALVKDLQTQADMICKKIGEDNPSLAFDLLWEFVSLAPSVYARVDDSRGEVDNVFRYARDNFAQIAPLAMLDSRTLATRVWDAVQDNLYGEFDGIIGLLAAALGDDGLEHLKALVTAHGNAPMSEYNDDHEALVFLRSLRGEDHHPNAQKLRSVKIWLQEIAIAQDDAVGFVAQYTDQDLLRPDVAAEVARLWVETGRSDDALNLLEEVDLDAWAEGHEAWDEAYIACLLDLGRIDDVQSHRWTRFEHTLSVSHLREYLKPLPDFDDIEVEDQAKAFALSFPQFHVALGFFLNWPDLMLAARVVEARTDEVNGEMYWTLTPAVDALRQRHPLAAVLLMRSMIDFALGQNQVSRYGNAADLLMDCDALDAEIENYGAFQSHDTYLKHLEVRHDRKTLFWSRMRL